MRNDDLNAGARENVSNLAALLGLPAFEPGSVWIAGAGPGDPGLVTLLGAHAIRQADVILYDALLNTALLKLAGAETELVFAGKRKGMPPTRQAEISARLVALAKENKRVLRLKGGDPFVFGRGGEEALALAQAGVPFRIVPGVTAGIGGLAYAGIPVTHRDTNHAVTFLTGHGSDGNLPPLDWSAISKGSPTLVLYMALAHAEEIATKLIAAGRSPDEPAAIISNATLPDQSVRTMTLSEMGEQARESSAPAVFVIGENVRLRKGFDWLSMASKGSSLTDTK
jgi:uroporphyrin-III C-methyltransferase